MGPPATIADQSTNHLAPHQSLYYDGSDILRDQFMNSSNIFFGLGFGSNPEAYAGVVQLGIQTDLDALREINLTELSPIGAWI